MTQFITLAGQKQVGKDTSAQMIRELLIQHNFQYPPPKLELAAHVVHFADALKAACNVIFGIPLEDMESEEGKQKLTKVPWPIDISDTIEGANGMPLDYAIWQPDYQATRFMTVREVLQFVGTELFRNQLNPDVWLNSVFMQPWGEDETVIIADARFPNEAILGRKHGLLINVQRDTGLGSDGHASENALADFSDYHYVVQNNGSFEDLREKLYVVLKDHSLLMVS